LIYFSIGKSESTHYNIDKALHETKQLRMNRLFENNLEMWLGDCWNGEETIEHIKNQFKNEKFYIELDDEEAIIEDTYYTFWNENHNKYNEIIEDFLGVIEEGRQQVARAFN